jgi:hypothetical protein
MNIIAYIEAEAAKAEGEVKAAYAAVVAHLHGSKTALIAELEAEVAKGTPELQALWTKLKALL